MANRLKNKIALITGASRGMGASDAQRFIKEGASVALIDIRDDEGQKLANKLGPKAKFFHLDVSDGSNWPNVISKIENAFGPINILVNNAGVSGSSGTVENTSEKQFRKVLNTDLIGVYLGIHNVIPSMRKAGGGSIINISSIGGIVTLPNNVAYTTAKFGVRGMTKSAAIDLVKEGIRVNSVHPGVIGTKMVREYGEKHPQDMKSMENDIPMGRLGKPEEITNLTLYLASDESTFSTGSEFVADGGQISPI